MKAKDFKRPGGVIALPRAMIRSKAYRGLSLAARCLLVELQNRWAPGRTAINYSTREAAAALNVSQKTAVAVFREAASRGFIELAVPADHGGRKARGWRLTWQPGPDGREPSDDWALRENFAIPLETAKPVCDTPGNREHAKPEDPETKNQRLSRKRDTAGNRESALRDTAGNHLVLTMGGEHEDRIRTGD